MDDLSRREKFILYTNGRRELFEQMLSASQFYDKAILTLSSASLGLIYTLAHLGHAMNAIFLLYISCAFFILSIITSLLSFLLVQKHAQKRIKYIMNHFLPNQINSDNEEHLSTRMIFGSQICSGIWFVLAIIILTTFVSINIPAIKSTSSIAMYIESVN